MADIIRCLCPDGKQRNAYRVRTLRAPSRSEEGHCADLRERWTVHYKGRQMSGFTEPLREAGGALYRFIPDRRCKNGAMFDMA